MLLELLGLLLCISSHIILLIFIYMYIIVNNCIFFTFTPKITFTWAPLLVPHLTRDLYHLYHFISTIHYYRICLVDSTNLPVVWGEMCRQVGSRNCRQEIPQLSEPEPCALTKSFQRIWLVRHETFMVINGIYGDLMVI